MRKGRHGPNKNCLHQLEATTNGNTVMLFGYFNADLLLLHHTPRLHCSLVSGSDYGTVSTKRLAQGDKSKGCSTGLGVKQQLGLKGMRSAAPQLHRLGNRHGSSATMLSPNRCQQGNHVSVPLHCFEGNRVRVAATSVSRVTPLRANTSLNETARAGLRGEETQRDGRKGFHDWDAGPGREGVKGGGKRAM